MVLAAAAAAAGLDGATRRTLAYHACVGLGQAHSTVKNMVAAGELIVIGHARERGVSRPVNVYAVPVPCDPQEAPPARSWTDFK